MGKSRARMPAFYRQSIQNAVNQQINIGKSKHRTTLNREAIGQVVSYRSEEHTSELQSQ